MLHSCAHLIVFVIGFNVTWETEAVFRQVCIRIPAGGETQPLRHRVPSVDGCQVLGVLFIGKGGDVPGGGAENPPRKRDARCRRTADTIRRSWWCVELIFGEDWEGGRRGTYDVSPCLPACVFTGWRCILVRGDA